MTQRNAETIKLVTPDAAAQVVDALDIQIANANDPYIKQLLLQASCDIIEHTLAAHDPGHLKAA